MDFFLIITLGKAELADQRSKTSRYFKKEYIFIRHLVNPLSAFFEKVQRRKSSLAIMTTGFQDPCLKELEIVLPFSMPPWLARLVVRIIKNEEAAVQDANVPSSQGCRHFFVDGSARNSRFSIGICSETLTSGGNSMVKNRARLISSQISLIARYAELAALKGALDSFTSSGE